MDNLFALVQHISIFQVSYYSFICIFHKFTSPVCYLFREFSGTIHRLDYRQFILFTQIIIILSESGSSMHNSGSIVHGNIICQSHVERFFFGNNEREKLFIFFVFQVFSCIFFHDLVFIIDHFQTCFCQNEILFVMLDLHINCIRMNNKSYIRDKCPRCSGPG